MAGMGKRLRPHTLTVPKPLIPIAGKPIVKRLVEDIANVCNQPINEVAFVIGDFGIEIEQELISIAQSVGAKGTIHYQKEALGTAHAIFCAESALNGQVVVAFADTLFKADFTIQPGQSTIWVKKVNDPSAFGVVTLNNQGKIEAFVEKPKDFVSDLAIIGIYYFADGAALHRELKYLLDNKIRVGKEYQLTDALENLKTNGTDFAVNHVTEWLDCGNKKAAVAANQRYLDFIKHKENLQSPTAQVETSVIIEPVFLGESVTIKNSVIGPYVSIGANTQIENAIIKNSIIQKNAVVQNAHLQNSMLGSHSIYKGKPADLSIGDFNHFEG